MAIKTQGTQLYIIDPGASGDAEILVVECATSVDGVGGAREQIETTCLEDIARQYEAGLVTPETVTVTINFDPRNESHVRLHELYREGIKFDMAIAWGDGTDAPTLASDGTFDFPTSRTFIEALQTYVSNLPFNFALNSVVTSSMTFQLSGFPTLYPKVP